MLGDQQIPRPCGHVAWIGPVGTSCETEVGWCAAKGKKLEKNSLKGGRGKWLGFFNRHVMSLCNCCLYVCVGVCVVLLLVYFCHWLKSFKQCVDCSEKVSIVACPRGWFCYSEVPGPRPRSFPQDANVLRGESFCFRVFHPGFWILGNCHATRQAG